MSRLLGAHVLIGLLGAATVAGQALAEPVRVACSGQHVLQNMQSGRTETRRAYDVYFVDTAAETVSRLYDGDMQDLEDRGWSCDVSESFASCTRRAMGIGGVDDSFEIDLGSGEWHANESVSGWGPGEGFMPEVHGATSEKSGSCDIS